MKSGPFISIKAANKAFEEIKYKMGKPPILCLPNFKKAFEVACDASRVGTREVLSQEGYPMASSSEKLNEAKWSNQTLTHLSEVTWDLDFLEN